MLISISFFMGELPAKHPRALPANAAQLAVNTRLDDGAVTPISESTFVTDMVTPRQTVYLAGASWMGWDGDVNAVPGPTATDRLYVTGDGVPKMWANDTWYDLALPAPAAAATITAVLPAEPEDIETITYAYTFVTSFGEESGPSPLAASIEWVAGVSVDITGFSAPPASRAVTAMRIYRSQTTALGETDLYFVAEIPIATVTYTHDLSTAPLNEPLTTIDHNTPPDDLIGIIAMPNGMMVGFAGRELHFCEPYQPHTWPAKYSLTVDYDIVGLAAFGSNLAILTTGTPYRGQGYHPDSFSLDKIEENLPCVAKRGIVDLGYAAAYPSTEGLVLVTSAGAQIVTREMFTRRDWSNLQPASFVAANFSGRYFFGFSGTLEGASEKTAIIDLVGQTPFLLRSDTSVISAYHDIRTGELYVQEADNSLYVFDDVTASGWRTMKWRSKLYDIPFHAKFAAALIEGEELDTPSGFKADIIADGNVIHSITTMNKAVRLPAISAEEWEIEVSGMASITSIAMASSMNELANRG